MTFIRRLQRHPYHLVEASIWPFLTAFSILFMVIGFVFYLHSAQHGFSSFFVGLLCTTIVLSFWWLDVIKEGTFGGHYTKKVQQGLRIE